MEILIVDVGNTDIKRAIAIDDKLGAVTRNPTNAIESIAEDIANCGMPVALSSVRPGAADIIKGALARQGKSLAVEVNASIQNPVSGFYSGMGSDRIADIIAAWTEFGQKRPVAVIGLGTATAITAASVDGKFRGGFTTLGLEPLCQSLTTALPALPPIDPRKVSDIKPRFDVYNALCSGTVAGYLGIIEKWVSILKGELGSDLTVIATGGWSEFIGPKTNCVREIDPLLTVKGILAIARKSVQAGGRV